MRVKSVLCRWVCAAGCLLVFAGGADAYRLLPYQVRPTGSWADALAVGDVNGDGRDDVVLTTTYYFDEVNDFKIFVYLQTPDGKLSAPIKIPYGYANQTGVALADLDGKPGKEIVVGAMGVGILRWNPATAGFDIGWYGNDEMEGISPMDIAILDVDRDGWRDVVAQTWWQGATIFFGNGKGGIRSERVVPSGAGGYNDIKAGDLNADGWPDLVVTSGQGITDSEVYYNDGSADLSPPHSVTRSPSWPFTSATAIGDFTGDGRADLVVNRDQQTLSLFPQSSGGKLLSSRVVEAAEANALEAHDLNHDGRTDLLVQHGGGALGILLQSAGALGAETVYPGPYGTWFNTQGMGVGDLDGDGCKDVAVANYNYGLVTYQGYDCGAKADLRTSLGLTATSAAVRVDNIAPGIARSASIALFLTASQGFILPEALPKGCTSVSGTANALKVLNTLKVRCTLGDLRHGSSVTRVMRFRIVNGGGAAGLSAIATAATVSAELSRANNTASKVLAR